MARPDSRLARAKRRGVSMLAALSFTFVAILCLCSTAAKAQYTGSLDGYDNYGTVIGIDLGNTYSRVGVRVDGRTHIIANRRGHHSTPSWVAFGDEEILVGEAARDAFQSNPENTVFDVARLLGRNMHDEGFQEDMKHWLFKVREKDGKPVINVQYRRESRDFAPEEIVGMVMSEIKMMAEAYLGQKITHAVLTVPADYDDAQRQAMRDAAAHAGLKVLRVIDESRAAAIAYQLDRRGGEQRVLVYDLGGSTLRVSALAIDDGVFEALATASNLHLGGADFDERVMDYFVKAYRSETGTDVTSNLDALNKLKTEVEKAKRRLSTENWTQIDIQPFENGHHFSQTLTRVEFEELNTDLFLKTLDLVEHVLSEARIEKEDIDELLLIGGSTRIPKVHQLLTEYFGKEPAEGVQRHEAVVSGAAILAGILAGDEGTVDILIQDGCPLTLGIEAFGGVMSGIISRNSPVPVRRTRDFILPAHNQSCVLIRVFEGESSRVEDNSLLGELELADLPHVPDGVRRVQVTFHINEDGILSVSATTEGTTRSIVIENKKGRLSEEDINRMLREFERFAPTDATALPALLI